VFKDPLIVEKLHDGKNWKVHCGFTYTTEAGVDIVVPDGFITDFASIPRGLWNIFPPTGKYGHAAVVHDFLYRNTSMDRKECDDIFLEAMKELKVSWVSRYIIYRSVRRFGSFARETKAHSEARIEEGKKDDKLPQGQSCLDKKAEL
jgi:hypothetical protein